MVSFLSWFFLMENTWFCWLITSPRLHLLLLLQPSLLLIPPCYHRLPCLLLFFNSFPTVLFSYPIWFYPSLFPRSLLVSSSPMSPCLLFRILHLTDLFIPSSSCPFWSPSPLSCPWISYLLASFPLFPCLLLLLPVPLRLPFSPLLSVSSCPPVFAPFSSSLSFSSTSSRLS